MFKLQFLQYTSHTLTCAGPCRPFTAMQDRKVHVIYKKYTIYRMLHSQKVFFRVFPYGPRGETVSLHEIYSWEATSIMQDQIPKSLASHKIMITGGGKQTIVRMLRNKKEKRKWLDIDTQESLLYTCVVPDEGSVSCTMLVEATRWWVCCWCVLSRDCTDVAIAGAASPLWELWDNGSTADPFSSTILSIARLPRELCNINIICLESHVRREGSPKQRQDPIGLEM